MRRVAFLGLGELAEIAYLGVQEWGLQLVDVFDRERAGRTFFDCVVRSLAETADSEAERILVTAFDPRNPMGPGFLPEHVAAEQRMVWVFGQPAVEGRS